MCVFPSKSREVSCILSVFCSLASAVVVVLCEDGRTETDIGGREKKEEVTEGEKEGHLGDKKSRSSSLPRPLVSIWIGGTQAVKDSGRV